jgi:predicted nucleotidyltransferase
MFELAQQHLNQVRQILLAKQPTVPAFVFGSCATGKAKPFSDLDLMLKPAQALSWLNMCDLRQAFEESTLPITVDVVDWNACSDSFKQMVEPQLLAFCPAL